MRILLVWPAVSNAELYNFLPLGLGYLAANLPEKYIVDLWDGALNRSSNEEIADKINQFKPDLIGISVWNFNLSAARETINIIRKKFPGLVIVAGGPEPSGQREKIFTTLAIDYAFAGEGEKSFPQFLDLFFDNKLTPETKKTVSGLIYRDENGQAVCNPPRWENIDAINYCDYEFINFNRYLANGYYYGMHSNAKRTAPILTTRGCPFSCEYCSARMINGRKVRTRKIESVVAEIKELYEKYHIDGFNIIDDNFTFHTEYAKQLCHEILKLGLKNVSFNSPNGVRMEYLDDELLYLMKQVNWKWIFIAPESGSERTLRNMNKNLKLSVVKEKIKLINDAGLKVFGFFIIGYPGETINDIRKTINFACQNDFDAVVFTCFHPLPGTPVFEKLSANLEIRDLQEGSDYYEITYAPKDLTIQQLKFLRFWGLAKFYTSSFSRFKTVISYHSLKKKILLLKKII